MLDSAMGMRSPAESREKIAPNLAAACYAHKGVTDEQSRQLMPARARQPFSAWAAQAETIASSDYGGWSCGGEPAATPRREREKRQPPRPERPAARAPRHRRGRDPSDRFRTSAAAPRFSDAGRSFPQKRDRRRRRRRNRARACAPDWRRLQAG